MKTLSQILIDVNAYADLDASLPTNTELTTRSNYAGQAVWEASAIAQFSEFKKVYTTLATGATVPLPSNFREFMTPPRTLRSDGTWSDPIEEIAPEDMYERSTRDVYCYVLGNPSEGYNAIFNGLEANVTLSIVYQRYPSGLATLTDICELSDPQYVVTKVESYVLQSRSDDRFPTVEADANRKLQNMVGREMKNSLGGVNTVKKTQAANYVID